MGWMFAFGPAELVGRLGLYLDHLLDQFPLPLLLAGIFGAIYSCFKDRAVAALLGVVFAGTLVFSVGYDVSDVYVFFIPTYLMLALWISSGIGELSRMLEDVFQSLSLSGAGAVLACSVPILGIAAALFGAIGTHAQVDRSQDYAGREMIRAVSQKVEPAATVVHRRSPLLYMKMVEDRREDISLWDFREPHTQEELARVTEALHRGNLYFLMPDQDMISSFEAGGYEMVRVEGRMLYRAEPSGG